MTAEAQSAAARTRPRSSRRSSEALGHLGRLGLPLFLVAALITFSLLRPESFPTSTNLVSILDQQTIVVVGALAVMLPLIVGEFDLSVASNAALANILTVGLTERQGMDPGMVIPLVLLASTLIGLVNGLVVTHLRVNSFVGTLGTATVLGGLGLLYTGEQDILQAPASLTDLARSEFLGLPMTVYFMCVVAIVMWFALSYLPVGRKLFAVGGNRRAAELTGILVNRYVVGAFTVAGLLAGVAGVMLGARLGAASNATTTALLLPTFAAAFLGATTVRPGQFNVVGTVVAAYFLAVIVSGLQQIGAKSWVEPVFNGLALVVAVAVSGWALRAREAAARRDQLAHLEAADEAVAGGRDDARGVGAANEPGSGPET